MYGTKIRRLRDAQGISQTKLGEMVGLKQPAIANIENGTTRLAQADLLKALARALGVTVNDIVADDGEPEQAQA